MLHALKCAMFDTIRYSCFDTRCILGIIQNMVGVGRTVSTVKKYDESKSSRVIHSSLYDERKIWGNSPVLKVHYRFYNPRKRILFVPTPIQMSPMMTTFHSFSDLSSLQRLSSQPSWMNVKGGMMRRRQQVIPGYFCFHLFYLICITFSN